MHRLFHLLSQGHLDCHAEIHFMHGERYLVCMGIGMLAMFPLCTGQRPPILVSAAARPHYSSPCSELACLLRRSLATAATMA